MKKLIYSLTIITTISFGASAQNPYASIGKKTKPMLSLSNGKYVEHFENDSIRQIGSVMINMNTEQIVAFVDRKEQAKKNHSKTSSRFLSIDPLARQFPMLTPYQYASNRPIDGIDLDGLEYAKPEVGKNTLLIVVQGWVQVDPNNQETQTSNASKKSGKMASDGALGTLGSELAANNKDLQTVTFASSSTYNTNADVINTIREFKKANPHGKIIGVGHSLGGENLLKASQATGAVLDLLITIDPRGTGNYASETFNYTSSNVSNAINYWQYDFSGISGTKVDFDKKTNGANVKVKGTGHRSIDDDIKSKAKSDIESFLGGSDPVKEAKKSLEIDLTKKKN